MRDTTDNHPHLNTYLRRIGAVTKNFRRFVIETPGTAGYKRTIAQIKIDAENNIICDVDEFKPTDAEREAIDAELTQFPFPHSIEATKATNKWPQELKDAPKEHLCVFYDQSGNKVLMIQHRRNGEKPDLPFSFWSDGQWRCMEPDGLLPIYGLEKLNQKAMFFIHEGAKGARDVSAMIAKGGATLAAHPWAEELKDGAHLGWPGGATNADRVDWSPIRKLPPTDRIILICDHDQAGKEAATTISEKLRRPLEVIFIDDRFPPNFDLADPWPNKPEWWQGPKYIGPTFDDCLIPATWATDIIMAPTKKGPGRPSFKVRDQFATEWTWVTVPPVFVHRAQCDRLLNNDAFNRGVRPFSNVDDTARLLIRKVSSQADSTTYDPGEHSGMINRGGRRLINCYRPPTIKAIKGKVEHFERFMEHLVPDEGDRNKLLRWIATLIARPDIRMTYGVLLISQVQGVGKGTLGEAILTPLLGKWNVAVPNEQQLIDSSFNSWQAYTRLALVHEIYSGHSVKAYNRLKSAITDVFVRVNEKFMAAYDLETFTHVFACSNSMRALHIEDTDRRWLIPRVTEKTLRNLWWKYFHRWLRGDGLGIIRYWAEQYVAKHGPVLQGEHAPETSLKKEIIAEGRSEGERLAFDLAITARDFGDKVVFAMEDVRDWVRSQRKLELNDQRLEKSATLRKVMKTAGLQEPNIMQGGERKRFKITITKMINAAAAPTTETFYSYIVANFEIGEDATWADLELYYKKPEDVLPM